MNIYDEYPSSVEVDGKSYSLNLAFDRVLRVIDIGEREDLTRADKLAAQCAWLLDESEALPPDAKTQSAIISAAFDLFPKSENPTGERYIDFKQDAAMIRSAFFRLGIDLQRDHIHIFRFLELIADLPSDTALMRTVEIRQKPLPKPNKHNAEQIAALRKAKDRCAIKYSEEERRDRFMQSLKNSK